MGTDMDKHTKTDTDTGTDMEKDTTQTLYMDNFNEQFTKKQECWKP